MWESIKKFVRKHKNKIMIGVGVTVLTYLGVHYLTKRSDIKLSGFIQSVKDGYVKDVIIEGKNIMFKSASSDWYKTHRGSFSIF